MAATVRPIDTGLQPAVAGYAALPRPPLGARLCDQCVRLHAQELLRYQQDRLQRLQQQILYHAELRPVLGRARRGHRRPSVVRHPLPDRRRAGSQARQEGRPLPQKPLLSAGPTTPMKDVRNQPSRFTAWRLLFCSACRSVASVCRCELDSVMHDLYAPNELRTFSLCYTALRIIGKPNGWGLQRVTQTCVVLQPKIPKP